MQNSQIIKRRLAELKKMSIQLKQSTQNTTEVNYDLLNDILQATKSSAQKIQSIKKINNKPTHIHSNTPNNKTQKTISTAPYQSLFPQNYHQHQHQSYPHPLSYSTKTLNPNYYNTNPNHSNSLSNHQHPSFPHNNYFINPNQQQQFDSQNQQFIGQLFVPQHVNSPIYHNSEQQLVTLREQNSNLQKFILTMRQQISQLKKKLQNTTKQQQWKNGLPFFHLNQQISAFYTRLKIHQQDYSKIDYIQYEAQLLLDKLIVKKSSGVGHPKELHMTDLKQVHYIDSIIMLMHFGIEKEDKSISKDDHSTDDFQENLFIKFNNQEELHRWDLALYINFKIIDSLKKDRLFSNYLKKSRSRSKSKNHSTQKHINESKSKRESQVIEDDSDLMKKLIERRDLYLQTKKLVSQRMIEKVNEKKMLQSSGNKKPVKEQIQQEFSETHPFQFHNQDNNLHQKTKFNYKFHHNQQNQQTTLNNQDFIDQKIQRVNTSKFVDFTNTLSENANYSINHVENVFIPPLNISSNKKQKELSFSPDDHNLSISQKLAQEQKSHQLQQMNRIQKQKQAKIKQIITKFTLQGYDLTKYSKDGFNPHDKRFYISQDLKKLCWEQEGAKNKKHIDLKAIKQVQSQKIGQGIRKHIKKPKKQQYCIISYVKDNKIKVIELGANSTVMAQFVDELRTLLDHLKILKLEKDI